MGLLESVVSFGCGQKDGGEIMSALRMCEGCIHNFDRGNLGDCKVSHAKRADYLNKDGVCPEKENGNPGNYDNGGK